MSTKNLVETWIVNPELSEAAFEGKQQPVDNGCERLDPSRYYSDQREVDRYDHGEK